MPTAKLETPMKLVMKTTANHLFFVQTDFQFVVR